MEETPRNSQTTRAILQLRELILNGELLPGERVPELGIVDRLGVSRTLYPRAYTAARAARELSALLGNPSYGRRAAEVGATVRAEGGAAAAAELIERV